MTTDDFLDVSSLRTQCYHSMEKAGLLESAEGEQEPVFAYINGERINLASQCCKVSSTTRFDIFWSDFSPKIREFAYLENRELSELIESRSRILQKIHKSEPEEDQTSFEMDEPLFDRFPNMTKRNLIIASAILFLYGLKVLIFGI